MDNIGNQSTLNLNDEKKFDNKEESMGVPHIIIEVEEINNKNFEIFDHPKLPPLEEVKYICQNLIIAK